MVHAIVFRPVRVGIVAKHLDESSGLGTYSRELLRGLAVNDDVETIVFVPAPAQAAIVPAGIRVVAGSALGKVSEARWATTSVPRAASREGIELLHYLWPCGHVSQGPPFVTTVHDALNYTIPEYRESSVIETAVRRLVRRSKLVFTVSDTAATSISRWYGLAPDRVTVTSLGVGPADPRPPSERGNWWLFLGGIERRKNLGVVLDAWAQLPEPRAPIEVVGVLHESPRHYQYSELPALGAPAVRPRGVVSAEHLEQLYRGAIGLVHPSRGEGFGLPPLEAMARGVPVVVADASAAPEVVGSAALLVKPDAASVAEAMAALWSDAELRSTLRRRGLERASELSWQRTVEATIHGYRRALAPGRS